MAFNVLYFVYIGVVSNSFNLLDSKICPLRKSHLIVANTNPGLGL